MTLQTRLVISFTILLLAVIAAVGVALIMGMVGAPIRVA